MLNFYEDDTYDSDRSLEFRNRLRDLVENEKFRQRLKGKLRKSEKLLADRNNDAPVTIPDIVDAHRTALRKDGRQLFDDEVIKKLPKPHAVLVSDLVRSACRHLAGAAFEDSQWDVAYSRFVRFVSDTLFISFDQEFAFDGWNGWDLPRTYNPWQAERTYNLWPSKTGLDVSLKLSFHSKQHELQTRLWIMSTGYCSESAFESFHKQVQRVLPVILNCCRRAFSADHDAEWKADLEKTCELLGDLLGDQSFRESEDRTGPESEEWAEPDTADSEPGPLLFNERNFVRGCVDSYFHDDDDELVKRIRSAIHFLVQGNQEECEAIRLVLFVSALEALVCWSDHGISSQIASYIAALLCPIGGDRHTAKGHLKDLYNLRSDAIHNLAPPPNEATQKALNIASVGLRAMLEWRWDRMSSGFRPLWEEFKKELIEAADSGRAVVGPSGNWASVIGSGAQV